jgi:ATP-binding cassette, subfamily B, bacterial
VAASTLRLVAGPPARAQSGALSGAALCGVARVGVELARPWPLALAVDHAIEHRPFTGPLSPLGGVSPGWLLGIAGVSVVGLTAVAGLLDMVADRSAERAAERIAAALRWQVFGHALRLSLRWHDRNRSGELVSRLTTDVGRMLDAIVSLTVIGLPETALLAGVLVVLLAVSPTLALVGLSVVPLLAALTVTQRRRVRAAESAARSEAGKLAGTATDLLRNVRAVQAFGRQDRAAAAFAARNTAQLNVELRAVDTETRWQPILDSVLAVGTGLVLVVGGRQVLAGAISTGTLLVVAAYLRELYGPVRSLTRLAATLAKAAASSARLAEVLYSSETVPEPANPRPAPPLAHSVRLDRVCFGYQPDRPVIADFDLEIRTGETVCLMGPSGAGKSTILHLLLRLYDVDGGAILLDGVDIRAMRLDSLRRRIAFVPQDPWLLDATIAENIAFGAERPTLRAVLAAGRAAQLDEVVADLPAGYDTPLGEAGVGLSGGQRRRVALARAALSSAPLMLLDEPTASLDQGSAQAVVRAIRATTEARTVLIVTHDRELAALADRVVVLDRYPVPVPDRVSTLPAGRR